MLGISTSILACFFLLATRLRTFSDINKTPPTQNIKFVNHSIFDMNSILTELMRPIIFYLLVADFLSVCIIMIIVNWGGKISYSSCCDTS